MEEGTSSGPQCQAAPLNECRWGEGANHNGPPPHPLADAPGQVESWPRPPGKAGHLGHGRDPPHGSAQATRWGVGEEPVYC